MFFLLVKIRIRFYRKWIFLKRESFQLIDLFMRPLCFRISRLTNRYNKCKHYFIVVFQIRGSQAPMMKSGKTAGIIKSNTRSPVIYSSMLIRNLIITFEYLFQFIIRYLSGINNLYLYSLYSILPRYNIKIHIDTSTSGSIFQGIRHQVSKYLIYFIFIYPGNETSFQAVGYHCNRLTFSINTEYICQLFQKHNNLSRTYLEFQRIISSLLKSSIWFTSLSIRFTLRCTIRSRFLFSPVISGLLYNKETGPEIIVRGVRNS